MYPPTLGSEVKSDGERRVFSALERSLGDDWHVFHSAAWLARDPVAGSDEGEIDFVVAHPGRPILCLEVKGGGLGCQHGRWYRIENGAKQAMADPFTQASDHRHALRRLIGERDGGGFSDLAVEHGVVLTDVTVHQLVLAPDAPPEIVIDRNAVNGDMAPAVERVIAYHRGSRDPHRCAGPDGIKMLIDLLSPEVHLEVPFGQQILDDHTQLIQLTSEQARLLRSMARTRRLAVTGCAGSGKTMLAVEQARRLASEGERVLFVCFNRSLRDHLAGRGLDEHIDFETFHGLCSACGNEAGVLGPWPHPMPDDWWSDVLPEALVDAVDELGPRYDALVVDEAQDLNDHWLTALESTLHDPRAASIWLFRDDNQRVYDVQLTVPSDFAHYDLTVNCRNTQAIHREVMERYEGEITPEVRGPEGRPVETIETDDLASTLRSVLDRLRTEEEIPAQDIVVLSAHGTEKSAVYNEPLGPYALEVDPDPQSDAIRFSSIRAYKGLEAAVVILIELDDLHPAQREQQLYVAFSRARSHVIVIED